MTNRQRRDRIRDNGNHVTFRDLYDTADGIRKRVDRLQIAVVFLVAATASPKLHGPSLPGAVAWAWQAVGLS